MFDSKPKNGITLKLAGFSWRIFLNNSCFYHSGCGLKKKKNLGDVDQKGNFFHRQGNFLHSDERLQQRCIVI